MHEHITRTIIGNLYLAVEKNALVALRNYDLPNDPSIGTEEEQQVMQDVIRQLEEYLIGMRRDFTVATRPNGTVFQQAVWQETKNIPYGRYVTYTDIAHRIGRPRAVRAVGQALRANPILIIIPCHRIVGKNGILRGYAGGAILQEELLCLEQQTQTQTQ